MCERWRIKNVFSSKHHSDKRKKEVLRKYLFFSFITNYKNYFANSAFNSSTSTRLISNFKDKRLIVAILFLATAWFLFALRFNRVTAIVLCILDPKTHLLMENQSIVKNLLEYLKTLFDELGSKLGCKATKIN